MIAALRFAMRAVMALAVAFAAFTLLATGDVLITGLFVGAAACAWLALRLVGQFEQLTDVAGDDGFPA